MTELHGHIDALEAALQRLHEGDVQLSDQLPLLMEGIRDGVEELERRHRELLSLYEVGQDIASIQKLDQLLESILDRALLLVGAERGFLVLQDPDSDSYNVPVARRFDQGDVDSAQEEFSHGVVRHVLANQEAVVTTDAQQDSRFQARQSIITYQIRSVLAAPMIAKEQLIGAIYVDTRLSARFFGESDLALLEAMANHAAVAIQLAQLYEDLQARNRQLQEALQELQKAQNELIRVERLSVVGRMASSLIHDLKNPMTTIKGYASILGRANLSPEIRVRSSEMIIRSVDTFVEMTREILDYARGGGPLRPTETTVAHLMNDLCDSFELAFEEAGLKLEHDLAYRGPIVIDETRMRRALYNIVTNARDAMDAGGSLSIATRRAGDTVEFVFRDTGSGIPPEIQDSLFEPFVTYGKTTGTGLGLAIAKKIVEDHGGMIFVESAPALGATFRISVPLALPELGTVPD
jgi:signal transduction histidine kinase